MLKIFFGGTALAVFLRTAVADLLRAYIDQAKTRWTNCNSGEFSGCDRWIASCPFHLGQLLPPAHPTKPARERQGRREEEEVR